MKKLIEFAKNYKPRYNYLPEEVLEDAKEAGLLSTYKEVESYLVDERRWGVDQETIYEVDGKHILFSVYTLTGDSTGDDELNDVYEVRESHELKRVWVATTEDGFEDKEDFVPLTLEEFREGIRGLPDSFDDVRINAISAVMQSILDKLDNDNFISKQTVAELVSDWFEYPEDWRMEYIR